MDRPVRETERRGRAPHRVDDRRACDRRHRRVTASRRCVSSKNGPSSGSGLSKIANGVNTPVRQHALRSRTRGPAMNVLDRISSSTAGAQRADLRSRQQRRDAAERRDELAGRVGANHAAAARQRHRLEHARDTAGPPCDAAMSVGVDRRRMIRAAPAARPAPAARALSRLFALARAASGGLPRQAQRLRDARREHDRPIADRDHAVDRPIRAPPRRSRRRDASSS